MQSIKVFPIFRSLFLGSEYELCSLLSLLSFAPSFFEIIILDGRVVNDVFGIESSTSVL